MLNLEKIQIPLQRPNEPFPININNITQPFIGKVIEKNGADLFKNVSKDGLRLIRDIVDIVPVRKRVLYKDVLTRLEKRKWKNIGKYIGQDYTKHPTFKVNRKEFVQLIKYNINADVLDLIVKSSKE